MDPTILTIVAAVIGLVVIALASGILHVRGTVHDPRIMRLLSPKRMYVSHSRIEGITASIRSDRSTAVTDGGHEQILDIRYGIRHVQVVIANDLSYVSIDAPELLGKLTGHADTESPLGLDLYPLVEAAAIRAGLI